MPAFNHTSLQGKFKILKLQQESTKKKKKVIQHLELHAAGLIPNNHFIFNFSNLVSFCIIFRNIKFLLTIIFIFDRVNFLSSTSFILNN